MRRAATRAVGEAAKRRTTTTPTTTTLPTFLEETFFDARRRRRRRRHHRSVKEVAFSKRRAFGVLTTFFALGRCRPSSSSSSSSWASWTRRVLSDDARSRENGEAEKSLDEEEGHVASSFSTISYGDIDDSRVPPELKRRTLVATMRRHRQRKDIKSVQETFDVLQKHHKYPGRGAYNVLVHCAADSGDPEAALEIVQSMVADNVIPDVTTHHGVLLAFCKSGRVKEAFDWLQMHCLGVPSSSLGHGGEDSDNKSGWEVHLKAPGEAVQLSEIFDEQDADADFPDDIDSNTEASRSMHQPAPQTALPAKLFTTLLRYAALHANREIFQATEVLMFQMNQPNLTPGADTLESKLRLVGTCSNGTSREVEEVWQMFKNVHKSMWAHSERVSAHCKIANRKFAKNGDKESAASKKSVEMAENALDALLWRLGKRVYSDSVPTAKFSERYNVKYRTGWSGARGLAAAQFLKRRDAIKKSRRKDSSKDARNPWKSWRKETANARQHRVIGAEDGNTRYGENSNSFRAENGDDFMKDEYLAEENEETVLELASRYAICAHEKEVRSACNAVSTMFANRGDVGKAKETFQMMTANEVRPDVYSFTALMRAELNAFLSPVHLHHQKEEEKNARTDEIVSRVEEALEGEEKEEEEEEEHITRKTFIEDDIHKKEDEDELEDRLDATFARVEALRERMLDAGIVPDAASFVTELVLAGKFYASMMDRDGSTLRLVQDRRRRVSNILLRMQSLHVKMDVVAYNALIGALSRNNDVESAFKTYKSMASSNITPDAVTFLELFLACERRGREVSDVLAHLNIPYPTHGEKREEMIQAALSDINDSSGDPLLIKAREYVDEAEREMELYGVRHTSESLTALVIARGKLRQPEKIVRLFETHFKATSDIGDDRFFATCVQSLSKIDPNEALRIFDEVYDKSSDNEKKIIRPNLYALNACVAACAELRQISDARKRVSKFVKDNPATPLSSDTLDALFKCAAASGAFAAQAPAIVKELVDQLGVTPSKKIFRQLYEGVGLAHENDRAVSKTLAQDMFGDAHAKKYEEKMASRKNKRVGDDDDDDDGSSGGGFEYYDDDEFFDDDDDDF
jgi:pentatricopeptide repeat protein